ncbi:MAG TPA: MIP/aquaporin family protein [Euzebyales bacterium]|nr:MIP/aquaporin family protein [Euzebyales bacterium]
MEPYVAEFLGTAILILLGDGVVANVLLNKSKGEASGWIVITFGWGMAVAIAVYTVGAVSGAHINPAVTIGLAAIGEFPIADVPGYVIAQLLGAMTGAGLVFLTYLPHWGITDDPGLKLAVFSTGPEVRDFPKNVVTEVLGTAMLLLGVLGITAGAGGAVGETAGEQLQALFGGGIAPLIVGLLVLSIGLSLGGPTGYAINPARDLGPRIMHALLPIPGKGGSDWEYSWVPVVGPIIGGILGAVIWTVMPWS